VTVQISGQTRVGYGERTKINFPPDAIHVFDAEGAAQARVAMS
jgi:hypothetical protein